MLTIINNFQIYFERSKSLQQRSKLVGLLFDPHRKLDGKNIQRQLHYMNIKAVDLADKARLTKQPQKHQQSKTKNQRSVVSNKEDRVLKSIYGLVHQT